MARWDELPGGGMDTKIIILSPDIGRKIHPQKFEGLSVNFDMFIWCRPFKSALTSRQNGFLKVNYDIVVGYVA